MAKVSCFIAEDYDQAFNLQILFCEYVELFEQLKSPEAATMSVNDRQEIELKLQDKLNEITLMVLMMKQVKSRSSQLNKTFIPSSRLTKQIHENRVAFH